MTAALLDFINIPLVECFQNLFQVKFVPRYFKEFKFHYKVKNNRKTKRIHIHREICLLLKFTQSTVTLIRFHMIVRV